jgi:chromosome segregation ATPase
MGIDEEISEMKAQVENADEEINTLKERWLTPLRDLLGKVSAKFSEYFQFDEVRWRGGSP